MIPRQATFVNFKPQLKIGPVSLSFIAIIAVFLLSLLYLSQSNRLSTRGYEINELEQTKARLLEEKERLEGEAARLKSLKEIQGGVSKSKLEPTKQINYISVNSNLAQK